jgi:hypothetical protein
MSDNYSQRYQQQQPGYFYPAGSDLEAQDGSSRSSYSRLWQLAAQQVLLQHNCPMAAVADGSSTVGADSQQQQQPQSGLTVPVTWRQPLADMMAARAAEALASGGSSEGSMQLCVAEDAPVLVVRLPDHLVDGQQDDASSSSSSSHHDGDGSSTGSSSGTSADLPGLTYCRLRTRYHPSDPLEGV